MKIDWFLHSFWDSIAKRDHDGLLKHFNKNAKIFWPNVDAVLSSTDYVQKIFEIPDDSWVFNIEKMDYKDSKAFTITKIISKTRNISFTSVSFFEFKDNLISKLDEYWSTNLEVPIPELDDKDK